MNRRTFLPAAACAVTGLAASRAAAQPPSTGTVVVDAPMKRTKNPVVTKAVCVLMPVGDSGVSGTLTFERVNKSKVKITGEVKGLKPGDHGFHVHQFGDLTDMQTGKSAGGHMDVGDDSPHGKPTEEKRHTGDLGNITANENGVATVDKTDEVISLNGAHSIVGRGFIVHADPDDFGQPTGNAGARVAIGVIGVAQDGLK